MDSLVAQLHTASLTSTAAKVMNVAGNPQVFFAKEMRAAGALHILAANLPDFDSSDFKDSSTITFTSTAKHSDENYLTNTLFNNPLKYLGS